MSGVAAGLLVLALAAPIRDGNGDGRLVVACLGDSNTLPGGFLVRHGWCDRLSSGRHRWQTVDHASGGATVTDFACTLGLPICGRAQLATALDDDAADAVILAFGTNDVAFGVELPDIVAAYQARRAEAAARGARAFVALTPPDFRSQASSRQIAALNRLLRASIPPEDLIDFARGMSRALYLHDEVHLNDRGQAKRARRALLALLGRWPARACGRTGSGSCRRYGREKAGGLAGGDPGSSPV